MDQPNYHVLLDGRMVGPYDRRTIVGMRIKHALTGDHMLVGGDGTRLTVRDLIGAVAAGAPPSIQNGPDRVLATYGGLLLEAGRGDLQVPNFRGEIELRVRSDVIRMAGRHRRLLRWREDRVKLPVCDIVHAQARGPRLDLWLRREGRAAPQRIGLYLFTADAAGELLKLLPPQVADVGQPGARAIAGATPAVAAGRVLMVAVLGITAAIGLVLLVLLSRRLY